MKPDKYKYTDSTSISSENTQNSITTTSIQKRTPAPPLDPNQRGNTVIKIMASIPCIDRLKWIRIDTNLCTIKEGMLLYITYLYTCTPISHSVLHGSLIST